jgi:hypothetical protein
MLSKLLLQNTPQPVRIACLHLPVSIPWCNITSLRARQPGPKIMVSLPGYSEPPCWDERGSWARPCEGLAFFARQQIARRARIGQTDSLLKILDPFFFH